MDRRDLGSNRFEAPDSRESHQTPASAPSQELHPHGGERLREIVFGLNDGLVTTLVFVMALAAVIHTNAALLALGEVLAGGISMARGGYRSARTAYVTLAVRLYEFGCRPRESVRATSTSVGASRSNPWASGASPNGGKYMASVQVRIRA